MRLNICHEGKRGNPYYQGMVGQASPPDIIDDKRGRLSYHIHLGSKSLTARYKGKPKSELDEMAIDDRLSRVYLESRQHCS